MKSYYQLRGQVSDRCSTGARGGSGSGVSQVPRFSLVGVYWHCFNIKP